MSHCNWFQKGVYSRFASVNHACEGKGMVSHKPPIELAQASKPDYIPLKREIPEIDGYQIAAALRQIPHL